MIITVNKVFVGTLDLSALERVEDLGVDKLPFHLIVRPGQVIEVDDRWYNLVNIQSSLKAGYISITDYNPNPGGQATWGLINGNILAQTDLQISLNSKIDAANVHNVPSGGLANQVLSKNSNSDYDLKWSSSGGGSSDHSLLSNLDYLNSGHTGFQPYTTNVSSFANDVGYITGIDSSDIINALGYTPYNNTNPSNFISNIIGQDLSTADNNVSGFITDIDLIPYLTISNAASEYLTISNASNIYITDAPNDSNAYGRQNNSWVEIIDSPNTWETITGNQSSVNLSGFTNDSNFIDLTDLSGGSGIEYSNVTGVITNSSPDQIVSISNSSHVSITGTYPNFSLVDFAQVAGNYITEETDPLSLHLNGENWFVNSPLSYSNVSNSISVDLSSYALIGSNVSSFANDSNYVDVANVHNVPSGGLIDQVLSKNSNSNYDLKWTNVSSGTIDHSLLSNLDYSNSGHTGFQPYTANVSSFANDAGYIVEAPIDNVTYGRKNGDWAEVTTTETDPLSLHLNGENWSVNSPLSYSNVSNSISINLSSYALIGANVSSFANDVGYITTETDPIFIASNAYHITNSDLLVLANTSGINTGNQDLSPYAKLDGSNQPFTGTVQLRTGSALSGTAPLKFISGNLMATAEAGGMEYYQDDYYLTMASPASYISQYPSSYNSTYIKSTGTTYFPPENAFNIAKPITGVFNDAWVQNTPANTNVRLHVDLGTAKTIVRIYLENLHHSGNPYGGCKNYTVWGSNEASAFAELTYGTDTNWTQIGGTYQLAIHVSADIPDPQYQLITNTGSYRYYAIKFVDSWGTYIGLRRIELQTNPGAGRNPIVVASQNNLTSGRVPFATTNGRLIDSSTITYSATTGLATTKPIIVTGSTDTVQLKTIANATQTNDVFQILASDGVTPYFNVIGNGKVGIGTATPQSSYGGIDIASGGNSIIIGADGAATTRTNATDKFGRYGMVHYTNAEEPTALLWGYNTSSQNNVYIGGGTSGLNAATKIHFYTAANNTTTTGTERVTIDSTGNVGIGTIAPTGKLHIAGTSDIIQQKIVANATQTNDVFQILASDGTTVRFATDVKGYIKILNSTGINNIMILGGTNGVPASQTGNYNTVVGDKAFKAATSGASNLILGYNAGALLNSGGSNILLGANAGNRQTTGSNILLIDNQDRTTAALELTNSLIYGVFNSTPASQTLTLNVGTMTVAYGTAQSTITRGLAVNAGLIAGATGSFVAKGSVDQNLLITDTTNDRIGIGVGSPTVKLDVGGSVKLGSAATDTITHTGRMIVRTTASDPKHATPASRPSGTVAEIAYYSGKMYFCTNDATPTWELITSS